MEEHNFAAVLAQVIPVVVLALVVEAGQEHRMRIDNNVGKSGWNAAGLVFQALVMAALAFLEVAALLSAFGDPPAAIKWFAGIRGVIGVGVLMIAVAQIRLVTLVGNYGNKCANPNWVKACGYTLLGVAAIGGILGAIYA